MEGLYQFYNERTNMYAVHEFDECSDNVTVSEVTVSDNHQTNEVQTKNLSNADLEAWLITHSKAPTAGIRHPIFRIVWFNLDKDPIPMRYNIRKHSLDLVLQDFQIEMAYNYGYTAAAGFATYREGRNENNELHSYSVFMSELLLSAWSHNSATGVTQGLCRGTASLISSMQSLLGHQKILVGHPMALAYMLAITLSYLVDRELLHENKAIAEVENRTGYHGWKRSAAGTAKGDYAVLSARVSGSATSLAGLRRIAKVVGEILSSASQFSVDLRTDDTSSHNFRIQSMERSVRECQYALQKRIATQGAQLDFLVQRTQIQLTALFNLIARRDANLSIALARDSRTLASASKRDSSSMKTLAAVTVAFLPGTFVASLFAMPLFNWDAEESSLVLKERFWIYWVVTLPLTVSTMIIWLSWTHRQALLRRAQDRRDRAQLVNDIEGNENVDDIGNDI